MFKIQGINTLATILILPAYLFAILQEPHNNYKETYHPSYDIIDIQPEGFEARITGMAFLSDGRMVISTRYQGVNGAPAIGREVGWGNLYLLDNVLTGTPQTIGMTTLDTEILEPMGLTVVNDEIYVINRLGVDRYDVEGNKAQITAHSGSEGAHPWAFGLAYFDGHLYGGYGAYTADAQLLTQGFKLSLTGERTLHGTGLRHTNGWTALPNGDIFTSDQQGNFLPANKMMHVRPDHFFGFAVGTNNPEETPPVIYLPEGIAGSSPSQPIYIDSGLYAGQVFLGEIRYPNFHRVFIEDIQGQWQGALFHHAGGLNCGVNRMAWGPDGNLYLGQLGQIEGNPSWSFKDNYTNPTDHPDNSDDAAMARIEEVEFGLKRIIPNGTATFEMLAVRSVKDGFDLEFTGELESGAADPAKYRVEQWSYELGNNGYGGVPVDSTDLQITSAELLPAGKTVRLRIEGLREGHVVHIKLLDVTSAEGEESWNKLTWYTLNKFGSDPVKITREPEPEAINEWLIKKSGAWYLNLPSSSQANVILTDVSGRQIRIKKNLQNGQELFDGNSLETGLYIVELDTGKSRSASKIIFFK